MFIFSVIFLIFPAEKVDSLEFSAHIKGMEPDIFIFRSASSVFLQKKLTVGGTLCGTRVYTRTTYVYPAEHYILLSDNTIFHVDHGDTWVSFPREFRVKTATKRTRAEF